MSDFLNELNEKQYEAVTSNSQYLRIVAGAGSGKTKVLTYRIAYLIEHEHIDPSKIVAITFTNKAANEMKERTRKIVDVSIKELVIKTFHSFCAYFLRQEISYCLDYPRSFIIYDEVDKKDTIKKAGEILGYKKNDEIVKKSISYIDCKKSNGIFPSDINESKFEFPDEKKCLEIFKLYEKIKYEDRALDFDDLLLKTIQILENFEDVKRKWQNKIKYILVDEFQDTNDIQYKLIKNLMKNDTSLFIVGDPDQTIYTWRGANQSIIMDLDKNFHGVKTVILNKNYRSTQKILQTANELISHNKYRIKKDLVTENNEGTDVQVFKAETASGEASWVVNKIVNLKSTNKDFKYSDVAILYRNSYLSSSIENKLMTSKIPYDIYGGIRFYQRREVKLALSYFRVVNNLNDDFYFLKIINEPKRKIGESTILTIQEEAKSNGLHIYEYLKNIKNYDTNIKDGVILTLYSLIEKLEKANERIYSKDEAVVAILNDLLRDVEFNPYILNLDEGEDRLNNVKELLNQINNFFKQNETGSLADFLDDISLASSQDDVKDVDNVKLMTIHTAKGLEFKYVFLIGLNKDIFPSSRTLDENPIYGMEEERRLCYVAFTRAIKELYVSCNQDFSFIYRTNMLPSIFFKEANLNINKMKYVQEPIKSINKPKYNYINSIDKGSIFNSTQPKPIKSITWNVGDKLIHQKFGEGKVIDIIDDILVIDFNEQGIKKIISHYNGLTKIYDKEANL